MRNKDYKPQNLKCKAAEFKSSPVFRFTFYILHFTFYIFLLSSCYEPRSGCLDIRATDFEVDSDEPCGDCCEYPELRLNILHRVGVQDTFFNLVYVDSVYLDGVQNPFRINAIQFFVSNMRVVDRDDTEFGVADKMEITYQMPNGEIKQDSVEDNFALINPNNFRAAVFGTFARPGNYNKVRFTLGIGNPTNKVDPSNLEEDHPLTTSGMHWSVDSGYVFNRLELFRDTIATDTIPIVVEIGGEGQTREVELEFPETFLLDNGLNFSITVQIDYLSWFNSVSVKTDSVEVLAAKIVDQLAESFSLIAVEGE